MNVEDIYRPTSDGRTGFERVVAAADACTERDPHYQGGDRNGEIRFRCPNHQGTSTTSLSVQANGTKALIYCHGGCSFEQVVHALGIEKCDLFDGEPETQKRREVATYDYCDEHGAVISRVVRYEPKGFSQRRRDPAGPGWINSVAGVRKVPYRLLEVVAAVAAGNPIWIVEGEKDVETLRTLDQVASCNAGGARKWKDEHSEPFKGAKDVRIIADDDASGRDHAREVAASLRAVGARVKLCLPAEGCKDVTEHVEAGHPLEALRAWGEEEPEEDLDDSDFDTDVNPNGIVDGLVYEGQVTNLVAGPKVGKTTATIQLCLCVAQGAPFLGRPTRQATVLYISQELGAAEMRRRALQIGSDLELPKSIVQLRSEKRFRYDGVTKDKQPPPYDLATENGRAKLARRIRAVRKEHPADPVVVILDTLEKTVELESKDDKGWKSLYQELPAFAAASKVALVPVDHTHRARQDADASTAAHGNQNKGRGAAVNVKLDAVRSKKTREVLYWTLDAASWFGEGVHTALVSPKRSDNRGLGFVPISWEEAAMIESQVTAAPSKADQAKARLKQILSQPGSFDDKELRRMLERENFTTPVARQAVKNWTREDPGGVDRLIWDGE